MTRVASACLLTPTAMRTMGRHFISTFCAIAALAVATATASAQDRSAAGAIASLPCSQLSLEALPMQNFTPGSRPFGIPLAAWSADAFDALKRRVDVCYAGRDRSDAAQAKSQIAYFRQFADPYIAQISRETDRFEAIKQSMLNELDAVRSETNARAASERLDAVEKKLEITSLPPDVRNEIVAAFDDAAADLERRQREAAEAQALDEKVKAAEADARARRQAAEQAKVDAERRKQAAEQATADVEERKRSQAARVQAAADAKAKVEAASNDAAAADREASEAQKAQADAAERERLAREETAKLEREERAAAEAGSRMDRGSSGANDTGQAGSAGASAGQAAGSDRSYRSKVACNPNLTNDASGKLNPDRSVLDCYVIVDINFYYYAGWSLGTMIEALNEMGLSVVWDAADRNTISFHGIGSHRLTGQKIDIGFQFEHTDATPTENETTSGGFILRQMSAGREIVSRPELVAFTNKITGVLVGKNERSVSTSGSPTNVPPEGFLTEKPIERPLRKIPPMPGNDRALTPSR